MKYCALLLLAAGLFIAQGFELEAQEIRSKDGFLFELEELSSQETRPFLLLGARMQPSQSRWDEFADSLEKFSNAQNCLNPPEISGTKWNTLDVNWKVLRSNRDIEVCLFRIFDTLNDPLLAVSWLKRQEYKVLDPWHPAGGGLRGVPPELVPELTVEAYIVTDIFEERVTLTRFDLPWTTKAKGYRIQIQFSNNDRLVTMFSSRQGR
jgi:hypothetical protein